MKTWNAAVTKEAEWRITDLMTNHASSQSGVNPTTHYL